MLWITLISLFVGIGVVSALLERFGFKAVAIVFGLGVPLLNGWWWYSDAALTPFLVLKAWSVGAGAVWIAALKDTSFGKKGWARAVMVWILAINLVEGAGILFVDKDPVTAINAILLVFTVALPAALTVGDDGGRRWLRYDIGLDWIAAYTLWNFAFAYANSPPPQPSGRWAALTIIHLGLPLLLMGGDSRRWLEARAYALGLTILWVCTFPEPPLMPWSEAWYHPVAADVFRWTGIVLTAAIFVRRWVQPRPQAPTLLKWIGRTAPEA